MKSKTTRPASVRNQNTVLGVYSCRMEWWSRWEWPNRWACCRQTPRPEPEEREHWAVRTDISEMLLIDSRHGNGLNGLSRMKIEAMARFVDKLEEMHESCQ